MGRKRRRTSGGGGGDVERRPVETGRPKRGVLNGNIENGGGGNDSVADAEAIDTVSAPAKLLNFEASNKAMLGGSRRRGAANLGKMDLNVEFSNEVKESVAAGAKELSRM